MANWNEISDEFSAFIHRVEGGYVNHPADPGRETNMGVTLATFKQLAPTLLGVAGTLDNLKKLTKEQHKKILRYYWTLANGDQYRNNAIAVYATELTWGSGEGGAKRMLRNAAKSLGKDLTGASNITPNDVVILNTLDTEQLFDAITAARWKFYKSLSTWPIFGKGWSNRMNLFVQLFKKKVLI